MPGEREYAIKHALTREVAYESLPQGSRARLHADFAAGSSAPRSSATSSRRCSPTTTRRRYGPRTPTLPGQATRPRRLRCGREAGWWLRRAAELAVGRYELEDAIGFYRRAIELETTGPSWRGSGTELAAAHGLRFDGERLVEAMETAIELADDPVLKGEMYADLALHSTGRVGMWRTYPKEGQVESWIDQGLRLTPPGGTGRAKALLASSFWPSSASTGRGCGGRRDRRAAGRHRPARAGPHRAVVRGCHAPASTSRR